MRIPHIWCSNTFRVASFATTTGICSRRASRCRFAPSSAPPASYAGRSGRSMGRASFTGTSRRPTSGWTNVVRHTWVISIGRCPSRSHCRITGALRRPRATLLPSCSMVLQTSAPICIHLAGSFMSSSPAGSRHGRASPRRSRLHPGGAAMFLRALTSSSCRCWRQTGTTVHQAHRRCLMNYAVSRRQPIWSH